MKQILVILALVAGLASCSTVKKSSSSVTTKRDSSAVTTTDETRTLRIDSVGTTIKTEEGSSSVRLDDRDKIIVNLDPAPGADSSDEITVTRIDPADYLSPEPGSKTIKIKVPGRTKTVEIITRKSSERVDSSRTELVQVVRKTTADSAGRRIAQKVNVSSQEKNTASSKEKRPIIYGWASLIAVLGLVGWYFLIYRRRRN